MMYLFMMHMVYEKENENESLHKARHHAKN